jgi:ABC-type nitrate/sulfonate/bicarbonate transport system permease component
VWWSGLALEEGEKAADLREFLISLSGRQMKYGVIYTTPALLVGMWQLLAIIDALERYTTAELREMANEFLRLLGSESNFKEVKELV